MEHTAKTNIGVIGVGHLGSLHAKMLADVFASAGISSANFIGVFDVDEPKRNEIAKKYNVQSFSSLEHLLQNVQAVTIAANTRFHFEIAQLSLEKGIHCFIEKPITTTPNEADELIALAKKNNCKIQVGHIERFNPALLAIEQYNISPMFIEAHRLAQFTARGTDVAVVLDLMIHDIDIILSFVKSPVAQIDANGVAVVSDSVDIANARIRFENGCVANVTASRISQQKMRKMRMFQSDAYISVNFSEGSAEVFRIVDENFPLQSRMMKLGAIDSGKIQRNIIFEQPEIPQLNPLKVELEEFLKSIQENTEPKVTAEEGKQALIVASEILSKIEEQKFTMH
ncbi:MAG: Gfo/Idh/MocA family oxidoreductase [Ignavibacteriales bacterium]|nr:Gfo/Idh/MocA family oxidoreductase [Ignavibacteriales bacterium]